MTDQALIWSRSYDREVSAILGLPGEVSEAIAEQIRFRVTANARESIERRHPANAAAYDLDLRGRVLSNHRKPVMTKRAIDYYNQAIALDPNYAIAWSGIADAYAVGPINGDADPGVSFPLARQAASEALHAGPNHTEVQVSQGIVNFWIEWNWPLAEQMLRRTITQNSGYPLAHQLLGNILSHSGRHAEAQEEMRLARGLDPLDPMLQAISSQDAFNARDYRLAAEHARQAILLDPEFWVGYMELGQALLEQGQTDRSLEALAAAERYSGGNSKPVSTKGYLLAKAGQIGDARAVLEQLTARSHERYVPMYSIALVIRRAWETPRPCSQRWRPRSWRATYISYS